MSSSYSPEYVHFTNNLADINRMAQKNPEKLVLHTDKHFHDSICKLAKKVAARGCQVVLLSGPSSSGKTTTAHFLADALNRLGHQTEMISLDDFYRAEEETPYRADGQHDFECLEALRLDCIQQCLHDLVTSGSCNVPLFDFVHHRPQPQFRHLNLKKNGIAIIEGIHALNPVLTAELPYNQITRIYISVKQDIYNGTEELLSAQEVRMIRRMVRDYNFRSTTPESTLKMWNSVMEGERKYIKPFKRMADFTVNSLHAYELGVLRGPALMLLHNVEESTGWIAEEMRRLSFALMLFTPVSASLLPPTSLIREFIGGGLYN